MRNALKGSEERGFPVLRKQSAITDKNMFVLAELHNNENKQITVAVNASNAYLIAYKTGNKSLFCRDANDAARRLLFDGTTKKNLTFSSSYPSKPQRSSVPLGMEQLGVAIQSFSDLNESEETTVMDAQYHFVVLIEMIAEAARFKFIELKITEDIGKSYTPKADTISLEDYWGDLSERILGAHKDGTFTSNVTLKYANGTPRIVSKIEDIRPDISLLKTPIIKGP